MVTGMTKPPLRHSNQIILGQAEHQVARSVQHPYIQVIPTGVPLCEAELSQSPGFLETGTRAGRSQTQEIWEH